MTISSIVWVPKGASKEEPLRFKLTDAEYESIQSKIASHIKEIKEEPPSDAEIAAVIAESSKKQPQASATSTANSKDDFIKEFDLDNYDDDEDADFLPDGNENDEESDDDDGNDSLTEEKDGSLFASVKGLTFQDGESKDPYITLADAEDEAEELEEMMVASTDNLILAAKTEDDISHIEVYLYEGGEDNLFVHHDIMLPSFPLCLEWLNFDIVGNGQGKGNYVAVGTFDPEIEIWDLDIIDASYPTIILGSSKAPFESRGSTRKKRASKKPHDEYHVDAIMCLAWNRQHPSLLASGSADTTIKLWDLNSATPEKAIRSFSNHKAKVQALAWNLVQGEVLLSGGYDNQAHVFDTRAPAAVNIFKLTADVEALKWDPIHPERFFVSTEDGVVKCFDGRNTKTSVFTIHAHDGAVSALDISARVDGLIVTGGDKATKIWATEDPGAIKCLASKDLQVGKVYSACFSPDDDLVVGVAGGAGKVVVWNLEGNPSVRRAVKGAESDGSSAKKEVTTVEEDDGEDTDNDMDED
ncbi:hypothetical protein HK100_006711 [Physocladia obscura]|uniref:Uncharacterized protein n=1 Tax=Physocladia obscura TaxID=109957 RepID=A0AAD5T6X3_9FUNG|nr:hypothetical protein HK100_006711 [Physocladia obscura]